MRVRGRARPASGRVFTDPGEVDWTRYDFIDLGASAGGSLHHCSVRYGGARGIGVDISPAKAESTAAAGFDVLLADATELEVDAAVRFASMLDFLEHLPDRASVERILRQASRWVREFLVIQHPSFEGEGTVEHLGVRQYWWNWSGHTVHPTVADYCNWFEELELDRYVIRYRERVTDSSHPSVIPTAAPPNQQAYDPAVHPPKPQVEFAQPLWRLQRITAGVGGVSHGTWRAAASVR